MIHKRRLLYFWISRPPPSPSRPSFSPKNRLKNPFLTPPSLPLKEDVVYEWSLSIIYQLKGLVGIEPEQLKNYNTGLPSFQGINRNFLEIHKILLQK